MMSSLARLGVVMLSLACFGSCCSINSAASLTNSIKRAVYGIEGLQNCLTYPKHLEKKDAKKGSGDFDVASYFTVLKHLSMESGYRLDYVYAYDIGGGRPVLYAHKLNDAPFNTESELLRAFRKKARLDEVEALEAAYQESTRGLEYPKDKEAIEKAKERMELGIKSIPEREYVKWYLEHIRIDGTPEGYYEYAILSLYAEKFYQYWHALYYDIIVCTSPDDLRMILAITNNIGTSLPADIWDKASHLDYAPSIEVGEKEVKLSFMTFTKWGGFQRRHYAIKAGFPHMITKEYAETVLGYSCGVWY